MQYDSQQVTVATKPKEDEILVHHALSIFASHDPKDLPNCHIQRETLARNVIRKDSDKEINYVVNLLDSHDGALSLDNDTFNIKSYHHEMSYTASAKHLDKLRKELKCGMLQRIKKCEIFPSGDPNDYVYVSQNAGILVESLNHDNFQFLRAIYMDYLNYTAFKKRRESLAINYKINQPTNSNNSIIGTHTLLPYLYFIVRLQQKCPIRNINSKKYFVVSQLSFPIYKPRIDGIMLFSDGAMKQTCDSKMRYRHNNVEPSKSSKILNFSADMAYLGMPSSGGGNSLKVGSSKSKEDKDKETISFFGDLGSSSLKYVNFGSPDAETLDFSNPDKVFFSSQLKEDIDFLSSIKVTKGYSMSFFACKMDDAALFKSWEQQEDIEEVPMMRRKTIESFHDADISVGPVSLTSVTSNVIMKSRPSYYNTDYEYFVLFDSIFTHPELSPSAQMFGAVSSMFSSDKRTYGEKLISVVDDLLTGYI